MTRSLSGLPAPGCGAVLRKSRSSPPPAHLPPLSPGSRPPPPPLPPPPPPSTAPRRPRLSLPAPGPAARGPAAGGRSGGGAAPAHALRQAAVGHPNPASARPPPPRSAWEEEMSGCLRPLLARRGSPRGARAGPSCGRAVGTLGWAELTAPGGCLPASSCFPRGSRPRTHGCQADRGQRTAGPDTESLRTAWGRLCFF